MWSMMDLDGAFWRWLIVWASSRPVIDSSDFILSMNVFSLHTACSLSQYVKKTYVIQTIYQGTVWIDF
jgi:hypothetical protein